MADVPTGAGFCGECGAPLPAGGTCRDNFDALLALEYGIPGGSGELPHFYAVASYVLQHPDTMGYTGEALVALLAGVSAALDGRVTAAQLREQARGFAAGNAVRRKAGAAETPWRRGGWPVTVADVLTVEPEREAYAARVTAWARSLRETLSPEVSER